jgi:antitoxin Phd
MMIFILTEFFLVIKHIYHLQNIIHVDRRYPAVYCLARLDRRAQMSKHWQLQEAKNKFSEVVEEALANGPQVITRRGTETAVVLSFEEYKSMQVCKHSISAFFQNSPLSGVKLDLKRDSSPERKGLKI